MQFVNDQFYELTGHTHAPNDQFEWFDLIADEDVGEVESDWAAMRQGKRSDGIQFRLKKTWVDQDGVQGHIWVQSSSYPILDEHGNVLSMLLPFPCRLPVSDHITGIMGTLFDISQFKWAEGVQRRRIEEALEAKRQQEKCRRPHFLLNAANAGQFHRHDFTRAP
jgi:PAS domain-containing protein